MSQRRRLPDSHPDQRGVSDQRDPVIPEQRKPLPPMRTRHRKPSGGLRFRDLIAFYRARLNGSVIWKSARHAAHGSKHTKRDTSRDASTAGARISADSVALRLFGVGIVCAVMGILFYLAGSYSE